MSTYTPAVFVDNAKLIPGLCSRDLETSQMPGIQAFTEAAAEGGNEGGNGLLRLATSQWDLMLFI